MSSRVSAIASLRSHALPGSRCPETVHCVQDIPVRCGVISVLGGASRPAVRHVDQLGSVSSNGIVISPVRNNKTRLCFGESSPKLEWREFWRMSPERLARLRALFDRIDKGLRRMAGTDSFDGAIKKLRSSFAEEGPAFAPWVHHRARREFPMSQPDTVDVGRFDAILKFMENREQFLAVLPQFPDEAALEIEQALLFIHQQYLPERGETMRATSKLFPHRPAGGRPVATPDLAERATICKELLELDSRRIRRGIAQKRIAERHSKSVREIQRIWRECAESKNKVII